MKSFLIGGVASCIAEVLTIPMDTVKVRLQIDNSLTFQNLIKDMIVNEGIGSFFNGLEPALLRQAFYGSLRYGLYPLFKHLLCYNDIEPQLLNRLLAGCLSGALSSAICNPTDLIKIRMQSARNLKYIHKNEDNKYIKPNDDFKYNSFSHALIQIVKTEGYQSLYTGVGPTVCRASVLAAVELSVYDIVKPFLSKNLQLSLHSIFLHAFTALVASFLSALISNPFDMARSRLMSQPKDKHGNGRFYKNVFDCLRILIKEKGLSVLFSGFWAYFLRLGPNTMIAFIVLEKLRSLLL